MGRTMTGQYSVTYLVVNNSLQIGNSDASAQWVVYPTAWLKENTAAWNAMSSRGLVIKLILKISWMLGVKLDLLLAAFSPGILPHL